MEGNHVRELYPNQMKRLRHMPKFSSTITELQAYRTLLKGPKGSGKLSNISISWDEVPKFFMSPEKQRTLRDEHGKLESIHYTYMQNGVEFQVQMIPATIKNPKNPEVDYHAFPSSSEQMLEEVMKQLLLEDNMSSIETDVEYRQHTYVRFTMQMLKDRLVKLGSTRSHGEIKRSLEILLRTRLVINSKDGKVCEHSLLSDIQLENFSFIKPIKRITKNCFYNVCLPAMLTEDILSANYRQFNVTLFSKIRSQLARDIYKQLVVNYRNANEDNAYSLTTEYVANTGNINDLPRSKGRDRIKNALNELKSDEINIIQEYDLPDIHSDTYVITPSKSFITAQIAANKQGQLIKFSSTE